MSKEHLDEREFELINILGGDLGANQRQLSLQMNLSLGLINLTIRRLIAKGYIRIEQLNNRKVKYILTPKGFSEKMRKSVKYTLKTLSSISLIKNRVREILQDLYVKGHRQFYIYGEEDFVTVVEMAFRELNYKEGKLSVLTALPEDRLDGILLWGKEGVDGDLSIKNFKVLNLVAEVSKDQAVTTLAKV